MTMAHPSRRTFVRQAGLAGLALSAGAIPAWALPDAWFAADDEVIPFTDVPADFSTKRGDAVVRFDLRELRSWITPTDQFFGVQHYGVPKVDAAAWRLETGGLFGQTRTLTLDDLKKRPRIERTVFFECSGNRAQAVHGLLGNATWAGASLKDLLHDLKPLPDAREAIFWAADQGEETIRGNKYTMHFARSMSLDEALRSDAIVAYEMNGQPLTAGHGAPVRLIVPGWYGVANVKWLTKIELSDTRFVNRFMGRDYVTVMGRQAGDQVEYTETWVGRQHVKSVIARVTRQAGRMKVYGAAWSDGTPLNAVDVRIDGGAWQPAKLEAQANPFAWTFFTLDTNALPAGQHTLVSRATDRTGRTQPASLELKKTYWEDNAQFTRTIMVS
jgi:DMSO/TMAO reductase YedYZ molybdopterin-dependent catalytic subunit